MSCDRQNSRTNNNVLLSVVLPVYNEERVLEELLRCIRQSLEVSGHRYEIVFVNDGSRDGSPRVLDELAARCEQVRVVHLSRNFGHQAAVQAGLAHARGDAVLLMDSDLQDSPGAIPRFVDEWQAGFDVVYAVRTQRKENWFKRFLFSSFYRLLQAISQTRIPLNAGNFSLIDRRVAQEIVGLAERDRYLPGLRAWVGYRQKGIVVERHARYDDQPRVSFWGLVRLAKTAIFAFSTFPLSVFYVLGLSALAAFAGLGSFSLFCKLFTSLAIPGWTSHVLSACFFGAINALGISILGEYVVRIYDQVRARPLYLVDRVVGGSVAESRAGSTEHGESTAADGGQPGIDGDAAYRALLDQVLQLVGANRTAAAPQPDGPVEPASKSRSPRSGKSPKKKDGARRSKKRLAR